MTPTFHSITLGCKLNQFDSAAMEGELARRGFTENPDRDRAGVIIINTCTVTHRADADARKLIRSVRRNNPACRLLVTGCFAERDAEAIRRIPGVDRVFGNREKPAIASILDEIGLVGKPVVRGDTGCEETLGLPDDLYFGDRSRAFLKIQEGCDLVCSYCIIPKVRGRSRSVPLEQVDTAMESLFRRGYREVVLTGVNTGDYGKDLEGGLILETLLERLLDRCGENRIRLNSLEPLTVTDGIIRLMAASGGRLAPHLQVPLQSGSEAVLRRMRRNYRASAWMDRMERLRAAMPDIGLGADMIVGFPGETEEEFQETCRLLASSPVNYLHVFSWSERPGTPASELHDRVHSATIRERSATLRRFADEAGFRFRSRFPGRQLDCVALGDGSRALTGNFIEVALDGKPAEPGSRVLAEIKTVTREQTRAVIVPG
ncbi:MAG: tRNA (N(6)-L-threonylcarbamoyladenosine(37)-C(2))-methylthiotransferase MtaB [Acidobacteria bacterium]|uniref:tRNA (N(6)-L-threonylcarbamoyladenosine(37)-C(2))-methylthiotransferase MtaB n=1 Tax=Candidatus Polarisedimenticola svalbardensis TaxID=2886004 RepID=A0A8J6XWI2_9BACT|nr:tRNA (N(6)-L-threonylcarbamoyladenosine(37)-C(2))-methylthiotransferase MtaB [Candidatus Polarisedimenticola svalbardensis]